MNKQELVKEVGARVEGVSQKQIDSVLKALIETIGDTIAKGDKVQLVGFGTFETRERAARQGRNPKDPTQVINIPASIAPAFKPGKDLKEKVNNK